MNGNHIAALEYLPILNPDWFDFTVREDSEDYRTLVVTVNPFVSNDTFHISQNGTMWDKEGRVVFEL